MSDAGASWASWTAFVVAHPAAADVDNLIVATDAKKIARAQ
jgi:hypothetical protein